MSDLRVRVVHIRIPPMSTIGIGEGFDDQGRIVEFAGDHRPMRDIGEALEAGFEPIVFVPAYAITRIETRDGTTGEERPS